MDEVDELLLFLSASSWRHDEAKARVLLLIRLALERLANDLLELWAFILLEEELHVLVILEIKLVVH